MTKARTIADLGTGFVNISDTGTEGTKVASGTTAQRGSTAGQFRFNTTTGNFEGRDSSGNFLTIEPTPVVSSVDTTEIASDAGGAATIVVTGSNFSSGGTVSFVGSTASFDAATTTFNSATQLTATAVRANFLNGQQPYKVRFTAASGVAGTSGSGLINVDNAPVFTTNAGSVGTLHDTNRAASNLTTIAATDSEGDTITFSIISGSVPPGITFNSNGTFSGTANQVSSDTTSNFTVRATAGSKTSDRAFTITVQKPPVYMHATGGAVTTDGDYRIHTFKNDAAGGYAYNNYTSAFVVQWTGTDSTYGDKVAYLIVAGGGASSSNGGGGAGGLLTNGATPTYNQTVTAQSYSLTVGGGGGDNNGSTGGTGDNSDGQGGDSTIFGLTALGGGLGGQNGGSLGNGGSGGGGASDFNVAAGSGTSGQGNNGGSGRDPHPESAGGGGGAGSAGTTPGNSGYGHGGDGLQNAISGTNIYYAGGGGGHGMFSNPGNGGQGGGADAGNNASYSSGDSAENYLGGGGASKTSIEGGATLTSQYSLNRNGGSGVIIVRYKYQ